MRDRFMRDLEALGVRRGDVLMIHSSFRSLGKVDGGAAAVIAWLVEYLGADGTLMFPAFSYRYVNRDNPVFNRRTTPSCVGYLAEYFRTEVPGVLRSMHATHSCTAFGKHAAEIVKDHELDLTPVGENSPLRKLVKYNGKILFLGCTAASTTLMHGVEETVEPIYLYHPDPVNYVLDDGDGNIIRQTARRHNFIVDGVLYEQRYARLANILGDGEISFGKILDADCQLLSAAAVWECGTQMLNEDPLSFVELKKMEVK